MSNPFLRSTYHAHQIGRRYKVMNPSKLRGSYGKLMYLLMDSESYHVKQDLRINFVK